MFFISIVALFILILVFLVATIVSFIAFLILSLADKYIRVQCEQKKCNTQIYLLFHFVIVVVVHVHALFFLLFFVLAVAFFILSFTFVVTAGWSSSTATVVNNSEGRFVLKVEPLIAVDRDPQVGHFHCNFHI
jgi:hypothetical protein